MDLNLTSIRIRTPPKRDVTLLGKGEPWIMNACLHFSNDMIGMYVEGYRRAAEQLIEQVERTHIEQDFLVYPILFLYRHHIELRLKELLELLYHLGSRSCPAPYGHNLLQFWFECKRDLEELVGDGGEKEWFRSVEHCIKQLATTDPDSDAFRYPTGRKHFKSAATLTHVNLATLRETMNAILDWLSSASDLLNDYRSDVR